MLVVTLLEGSEREEGVVAIHLPIGPLKTRCGWSQYRDANTVPTNPLADDIATAPSAPVIYVCMHVCMYVRTYACLYVCMYVCTYLCMHVCMCVCMHV